MIRKIRKISVQLIKIDANVFSNTNRTNQTNLANAWHLLS